VQKISCHPELHLLSQGRPDPCRRLTLGIPLCKLVTGIVFILVPLISHAKDLATQSEIIETPDRTAQQPDPRSAWSDFAPPVDTEYDWIQLKSKEWLKGELRSLYNFKIEFDSEEMGLQTFDWDDVLRLRTALPRSIRIETSQHQLKPPAVVGRIEMKEDDVFIISEDDHQKYSRTMIVSIGNTAHRELEYWNGNVSLGTNFRSGNSELIDINLMASARRLSATTRIVFDYVGSFSKAQGVSTANNHRINSHYDSFLSSRSFWRVINLEYTRDSLKNIEHQVLAGTSFGYDIIRSSKTEWSLAVGVGTSYKRYFSVADDGSPTERTPAILLGTLYDTSLTRSIDLLVRFNMQFMEEASGTYIHHFLSTVSSDFMADLDLEFTFIWDRVEDPRPDENNIKPRKNDFQLILGASYEF